MKALNICIWLCTFFALSTRAATLSPTSDSGGINVEITGVTMPDSIAKDLSSGFENRMLIRLTLLSRSGVLGRVEVVVAIKFDLWEERFVVRHYVNGQRVSELAISKVSEVTLHLSSLKIPHAFASGLVPMKEEVTMEAEMLLNPVDRERMEHLRQWVAENSAPRGAVGDTFTPRPNDLFNRIFEQYTSGADIVAPWKLKVVSAPFSLPVSRLN